MIRPVAKIAILTAGIAVVGSAMAGCAKDHLSPEFGSALRQDLAAQIADPDARYGKAPPADGARTALVYDRYQKGKVITPVGSASQVGVENSAAAPTLPPSP